VGGHETAWTTANLEGSASHVREREGERHKQKAHRTESTDHTHRRVSMLNSEQKRTRVVRTLLCAVPSSRLTVAVAVAVRAEKPGARQSTWAACGKRAHTGMVRDA
jgi:hypothetical protein